jgi:hypothetical protein
VRGGYEPEVLYASVGEPLRIVFSREETAPCSERVLFPEFGRSAMLPPFEDVALELVPERAGEYEFTCQLGVLRGKLVVAEDDGARAAGAAALPADQWRERSGAASGPDTVDGMLLALAAWLCTVPLLLVVAVPVVGWRGGAAGALVWLGFIVAACFALCLLRCTCTGSAKDLHTSFEAEVDTDVERERREPCTGITAGTGSG